MAFILLAFITIDVKGDKGISNSYINEATDNSYSIISGKVFSMATGEVLPGMASFPKYPSKFCLSLGVLIYIFVILSKLFSRRNNDE